MLSKNKLKYFASLKRKKNRVHENRFLVEGLRLCEELLDSDYVAEVLIYCPDRCHSERAHKLLSKFQEKHVPITEIDINQLNNLTETVHSQGIVCVAQKKAFDLAPFIDQPEINLIALDRISEPGNLGTIIRSASWFGIAGVLLSKDSAEVTNPKVLRASMGAVFHLAIFENLHLSESLSALQAKGFKLFAADAGSHTLFSDAIFTKKNVLILGNEIDGVAANLKSAADAALKIPKHGTGDSLNVAVAAGIIMEKMTFKKNLN
ncbi:MAG: TrmH family RNA methyltransferase [bacterium]